MAWDTNNTGCTLWIYKSRYEILYKRTSWSVIYVCQKYNDERRLRVFLQRYIQFTNNENKCRKGHENYNLLFKGLYVLDKLMKMLAKALDSIQ